MREKASPAMREVLERFGRKKPNGKLIYCTPTALEREMSDIRRPRSPQKIIYDTEALAQSAALGIYNLTGEMLFSYGCNRSRTGHRHLTHLAPQGYARLRGKAGYRKG